MKKRFNASEDEYDDGSESDASFADPVRNQKHSGAFIRVYMKSKPKKQFSRLVLVQELMREPAVAPPPGTMNSQMSSIGAKVSQSNAHDTKSSSTSNSPQLPQANAIEVGNGPVWVMKFNRDGRYLAAGGQDAVLRVWILVSEQDECLNSATSTSSRTNSPSSSPKPPRKDTTLAGSPNQPSPSSHLPPIFKQAPYRSFTGHKSDILDLSWSKNDFLLSSSMDKTVRLWHVSRKECLCCFQHSDFVTSIAFHPKDDRFFLSGCLDCRIRLWNIPEKKVQYWNEMPESTLITAVGFTMDGKTAIAGSYQGTCVFFETNGLKYNTQIHVRSTRGKNSKGEKITGIEAMPGLVAGEEKILITSNDSRLRVYQMRDKALFCKYKGLSNASSQIKAMFRYDRIVWFMMLIFNFAVVMMGNS